MLIATFFILLLKLFLATVSDGIPIWGLCLQASSNLGLSQFKLHCHMQFWPMTISSRQLEDEVHAWKVMWHTPLSLCMMLFLKICQWVKDIMHIYIYLIIYLIINVIIYSIVHQIYIISFLQTGWSLQTGCMLQRCYIVKGAWNYMTSYLMVTYYYALHYRINWQMYYFPFKQGVILHKESDRLTEYFDSEAELHAKCQQLAVLGLKWRNFLSKILIDQKEGAKSWPHLQNIYSIFKMIFYLQQVVGFHHLVFTKFSPRTFRPCRRWSSSVGMWSLSRAPGSLRAPASLANLSSPK